MNRATRPLKIVILGAGYVGLTSSACLAEIGHQVVCCDIDPAKIEALRNAVVPIYEPGLSELIAKQIAAGRISFSTSPQSEVGSADAVFIAVGTPSDANGAIDLSYVHAAARSIASDLRPGTVVVIKSTVVAGTASQVSAIIAAERGNSDISVASNPEFLREGSAIADFLQADRVVIGVEDGAAQALLEALYQPLVDAGIPLVVTRTANAELIKYAANAFLALKIGFINDVANLCEKLGGDVGEVAHGIGLDHRIGTAFLQAGPGFGGSCFPKDTQAFAHLGAQHGAAQPLIETLIANNDARKDMLAERIIANTPAGGHIAVLGTAFKANTDDVREAAALSIIPRLVAAGFSVHVHDCQPAYAMRQLEGVKWHETPIAAVHGADAVAVLTDWDLYKAINPRLLGSFMRGNALFDFRNIFDPAQASLAGLDYHGIGRPFLPAQKALRGAGRNSSALGLAASAA